jgi:molybdopterin-binding protein
VTAVAVFSMTEAARLLGVSDDTVRRWADTGRVTASRQPNGRLGIDGAELARLATSQADAPESGPAVAASVRNRLTGIVTRVVRDAVMAQVELQAGPFRLVSLISREAADELALEPGVLAVAVVKATNLGIELPER